MIVTYDVTLLLLLISAVAAQPPAAPPPYNFNPSTATIMIIMFCAVFFIGIFSLYLRLCSSHAASSSLLAASVRRRGSPVGLDAAALAAFPVFLYSEVKELKIGKNALECAICLNEFDDVETLRLIPHCDHVFHPECIGAWLEAHVTCPVCRANLIEKPINDVTTTTTLTAVRVVPQEEEVDPDAHPDPDAQTLDQSLGRRTRFLGPSAQDSSVGRRTGFFGPSALDRRTVKFPRSHSTGHSLVVVRPGEDTERFTLRFPESVRKEVMTRALVRTATFNNVKEGSYSRRGMRSYKRMDRAVKSDRWVINVPFFSNKGTDGEGSSRGRVTAVKLPSFKCLEPSASGDVDDVGPVRPEV